MYKVALKKRLKEALKIEKKRLCGERSDGIECEILYRWHCSDQLFITEFCKTGQHKEVRSASAIV